MTGTGLTKSGGGTYHPSRFTTNHTLSKYSSFKKRKPNPSNKAESSTDSSDTPNNTWIEIEAKLDSHCCKCGAEIISGDTVYWKKDFGVKCFPKCLNNSAYTPSSFPVVKQPRSLFF